MTTAIIIGLLIHLGVVTCLHIATLNTLQRMRTEHEAVANGAGTYRKCASGGVQFFYNSPKETP